MLKVFLVDDEIAIREGIRNSFPWEGSGYTLVGEAPDGELALHMIRDVNPDILLTDIRTPFMDGIQLCREVRQMMPRIGIIILSGYDDFNYAQQAISLGVQEYLLKPVAAQDLRDAMDRVSQRLMEERRTRDNIDSMRRRVATSERFVRERLLSTLFNEDLRDADAQQIIDQMRGLGINLAANCYVVMDVAFTAKDKTAALDTLYPLAEHSSDIVHICSFRHGARILVLGDNENDVEERSYSLAQSVVRELSSCGVGVVYVSIGEPTRHFAGITRSMKSARKIRHYISSHYHADGLSHIVGARDLDETMPANPQMDVRPLHERLQYISEDELDKAFSEYLSTLNSAMLHSDVLMNYLRVEAMITAHRIVRDTGGKPEEILPPEWHELGMQLEGQIEDFHPVLELLRRALSYRDGARPSRGNPAIARARYYLSRHFVNPNLLLQDVAKEVCMSNSRFSTVFAQETGFTFTEYLSQLRLNKAKELLLATNLRSSQIALDVGYSDPHYFSYLFKKATGFTPSEFRKRGISQAETEK